MFDAELNQVMAIAGNASRSAVEVAQIAHQLMGMLDEALSEKRKLQSILGEATKRLDASQERFDKFVEATARDAKIDDEHRSFKRALREIEHLTVLASLPEDQLLDLKGSWSCAAKSVAKALNRRTIRKAPGNEALKEYEVHPPENV